VSMGGPTVSPASIRALAKPTLDTLFHIDYDWWKRHGIQIDIELRSHLCPEHQAVFGDTAGSGKLDWVDERTGEVTQVNGLQHIIQVHCSKQPDYISRTLSLVNAVFRAFLANGNTPLNCRELSKTVGHTPEKILRTLCGARVYKGIRPLNLK